MTAADPRPRQYERPEHYQEIELVELVDRLLNTGVVLAGDLTLSVAGIDLVHVSLRLLVASAETMERGAPPQVTAGDARGQGGAR